jgi:amino acid transporter
MMNISDCLIEGGPGQFLAFWSVLASAVFSFLGAELVGVTVGEAQNPRKAVPRAVRMTFFRIVFFYLVLILLLGMTVPYNSTLLLSSVNESNNSVNAEASPFVVAARIAGVNTLPNLINVCLLVFTFSAANSDLYIATRTLYSLAVEGNAPRIFSNTNERGVPIYALGLSSVFCTIAFISEKIGAFKTFQYFVSLVTIFGILTWISILVSHIYFVRARMAQNIPDSALAFVSPFGANGSMTFLVFACVILVFNGWADFVHSAGMSFDWKHFIVDYIGIPLYLIMIFGYKVIMKTEGVKPEDADLFSGKAKIDEDEAEFLAEELRRKGGVHETRYERLYRVTLGNFF